MPTKNTYFGSPRTTEGLLLGALGLHEAAKSKSRDTFVYAYGPFARFLLWHYAGSMPDLCLIYAVDSPIRTHTNLNKDGNKIVPKIAPKWFPSKTSKCLIR